MTAREFVWRTKKVSFPSSSPFPTWKHLSWDGSALSAALSNGGHPILLHVKGLRLGKSMSGDSFMTKVRISVASYVSR